ncbi:MAG TPA: NAD-dependent epimerase/dehydratase family protein, partial [Pseudosphingobacterium sp.]|nr:NAD-dependent epimerase/dehydratase family protein [Pseudosphingobacterium sp.]
MIRIGVTGQNGFIGSHLKNTIGLSSDEFVLIPFSREYFDLPAMIDEFVSSCDVIVHLAALNRDEDQENLYNQNTKLVDNLIASLIRTEVRPHIVFSSSTQEEKGNSYGKSKRTGRGKFQDWARKYDGKFTGLLIPNVFGPFGKPYYNSFIATFCSQLVSGLEPHIDHDAQVSLIYVGELVEEIMRIVRKKHVEDLYMIKPTASCTVSEVLLKLQSFKEKYFSKGEIPSLPTIFDIQLF